MKSKGQVGAKRQGEVAGCADERTARHSDFMLQFSPLFHQLARTFFAFKQACAGQLNLSPAALGILALLGDRDGLTQQELTTILRIDPSLITRTVKEMEHERGWIRRAKDPADQRLMRVYLTDEGKARATELPDRARAIEERVLHHLGSEERAQLRQALRLLEEAARQDQESPPVTTETTSAQ